jgi:DNA-binding beta-propeller fold protein YncE
VAVRSDGKKAYVSSGSMKGGEVAVIDTEKDEVINRVKVGLGKEGNALGLTVKPFWWFEH